MIFAKSDAEKMIGRFTHFLPALPPGFPAVGGIFDIEIEEQTPIIARRTKWFVNLVSRGNIYSPDVGWGGYGDADLDILLPRVREQGYTGVSLRVIWRVAEPVRGQYNAELRDNMRRVAAAAKRHDLEFCIDFHTLFNGGPLSNPGDNKTQTWQCPAWVSGGHLKAIFLNQDVQRAFISMQLWFVHALVDLDPFMVMCLNEPYLWPVNSVALTDGIRAVLKAHTDDGHGIPITARLLPAYSPWNTANDGKRTGANTYDDANIIGLNAGHKEGDADLPQPILAAAVDAGASAGKDVWSTEGGISSGDADARVAFYMARNDLFWNTYKLDGCIDWNIDNSDGFWRPGYATFNLLSARNTFADHIVQSCTPRAQGHLASPATTVTVRRAIGTLRVRGIVQMPFGEAKFRYGLDHWSRPDGPDGLRDAMTEFEVVGESDVITILMLERQS